MQKYGSYDYTAEWREGFYVEEKMKRAWAAQMVLLEKIAQVCRENEIQYFADAGTLLGAVRHKGFIPWDDDIDICMKRKDYEKFIQIAGEKLPAGWLVCSPHCNDKWNQPFLRVLNADSYSLKCERMIRFHGCPYIVGVDIFPLDEIPQDKEEEKIQNMLLEAVARTISEIKKENDLESTLIKLESLCRVRIDRNRDIQNELFRLADNIAKMYCGENGEEIGWILNRMGNPEKLRCKKEWFAKSISMAFENMTVEVPVGYKEVLEVRYGEDYMIPRRGTAKHEYPFYRKQEEELQKKYEERESKGSDI